MLYFSFVLLHVMLHIEIWGAAPATYMARWDNKNNMLLISIFVVRYVDGRPVMNTASMYKQLGILKVKNVFKLRMFKLLVTLLNNYWPEFYDLLLRPYLIPHNYATRNSLFRHPLIICEVEHRAAACQLICLCDGVPYHFYDRDNKPIKTLVNNLKKYVLSCQQIILSPL